MSRTQEHPEIEYGPDGVAVYRGRAIPVPGARIVALRELVHPRELARPDQEPEAAVFSLSEIIAEPHLNWVLQAGTRLRGGEEDLFSLPWEQWLERGAQPVGVWAPERDAVGIFRLLAIDEREVRFARDTLERVLETRSKRIAIASGLGMSRRQVGELLGVSAARVQQLLEEAPATVKAGAEQLAADARLVLDSLSEGDIERDRVPLPSGWDRSRLEHVLDELVEHGLLDNDPSGRSLSTNASSTLRGKRLRALPERDATAGHG